MLRRLPRQPAAGGWYAARVLAVQLQAQSDPLYGRLSAPPCLTWLEMLLGALRCSAMPCP